MSDPTPIKALDDNAARDASKGHLIRTWERTHKALPAHVCEVSAA